MPGGLAILRSTTARFVILLALAQLLATSGVLYFLRTATSQALESEQQAGVRELRDSLLAEYQHGGRAKLVQAIDDRLDFSHGGVAVILLIGKDGKVVAGNLDAWPPTIDENADWKVLNLYRRRSRQPETMGFTASPLPDGSHLLSGRVIEGGVKLRRINDSGIIAALALALPLSLLLAAVLGRIIDRRIAGIADTAQAVSLGDLSQRVATRGSDDSFDRLAGGINAMLERIEQLVAELRMVTDGLAHDLRSPVTRLLSVIERTAADTGDPDCQAALEKVSVEARALLGMLTTALQISRADAGIGRERFALLDIRGLLDDMVEIYGPLAEDYGISLICKAPAGVKVTLHRELVSQAIGNLIENALNYATGASRIEIAAELHGRTLVLSVADDGPGIAPDQRALALRRFGRLDPSRHVAGSGLGLSLVEATAKLHGGTVELCDNAPGLCVRLMLEV